MKKLLSITFALFALLLTACDGSTNPSVEDESGSESSSTDESISIPGVDNYEEWIESWSEPGHLYIHYKRPGASDTEYNKYAVWIWPNAPLDLEGSLWGASDSNVQEKFYEMSTSWMTNIGGKGIDKDNYGKILDIDLTRTDIVGGQTNSKISFEGATRVGFLIVDQTSMGGGSHWTSDGGANMYINDFQTHWRSGSGSMHIFATQGCVSEYTFESSDKLPENPTIKDTTGKYRSASDVNSSVDIPGVNKTSEKFKEVGAGYQIFVASYRDSNGDGLGDLRGIIDALPELKELGVEALWLTPVQESESYHAYDTVDYYSIDKRFGTIDDYRELMYKAHENGMVVLMDLVLNHTSPNNIWFKKSQKAAVEKDANGNEINYRNLYHWKFKGDKVKQYNNGSWVDVLVEDHPDWYRDGESDYYYYAKFGSNMPELNYDCQLTRKLVKELAMYWLGFGLDGFRLDAVKHIYMRDEVYNLSSSDIVVFDTGVKAPYYDTQKDAIVTDHEFDYSSVINKNLNFWKDFANSVKSVYPNAFFVGENFDGYGMRIAPYYQALDSQFDFSLYYHVLENAYGNYGGTTLGSAQQAETQKPYSSNTYNDIYVDGKVAYQLPGGNRPDFINSPFTSNHDIARAINHVNNNSAKVNGTTDEYNKAKVAAAITILNPGVSWIYYGDELGMSSNTDKHKELYTYDNNLDLWYRQPYKWSNEDIITDYRFGGYQVEWDSHNKNLKTLEEQKANPNDGDMYDIYKQLITIKNMYGKNATYYGQYLNANTAVYYFKVTSDTGNFEIYIHTGNPDKSTNAALTNFSVNTSGEHWFVNNGTNTTSLQPYGVFVRKA